MPNTIKKIGELIPADIKIFYEKYPFEVYGDPYLRWKLKNCGVTLNKIAYDECYEIAMIGYLYSIHRCAYKNYLHTENYIKFMIKRCINIGLVLSNKDLYDFRNENCGVVYLDDEKNRNKF